MDHMQLLTKFVKSAASLIEGKQEDTQKVTGRGFNGYSFGTVQPCFLRREISANYFRKATSPLTLQAPTRVSKQIRRCNSCIPGAQTSTGASSKEYQ